MPDVLIDRGREAGDRADPVKVGDCFARIDIIVPHADSDDSCPLCNGRSTVFLIKNKWPLNECQSCRHRFCKSNLQVKDRIADQFDDRYFFGGESCYDDYTDLHCDLRRKGERYGRLLQDLLKSDDRECRRILDVGCAAGFLAEGFQQQGWQVTGIEANASMAQFGRDKLKLDIHQCTVEDFDVGQRFSAASLIQVLPHLIDPCTVLEQVRERLLPDGLLLIETWNRQSLTAKVLGRYWHQLNPPNVLHWFAKGRLLKLLRQYGFEVVQQGRPVKWINFGNGVAALRKSTSESKLISAFFSPTRLIPAGIRVPYFFDDVFWVIARKKDVKAPLPEEAPTQDNAKLNI